MARGTVVVLIAALVSFDAAGAGAETRGTLRFGMMPLDLESSSETPLFGDRVERAVERYNTAAAAYDRASGAMTPRIDATDLGVSETLFVISPGIELGAGHYFFRLEAPIGLASDLRSIGVGVYPLNLQARLRRGLDAYVSAGGTASWLDRPGSGDVGGLVAVRGAAGMRIARRFVIELGYSAFAIGGSVNEQRLENMSSMSIEDMQSLRPEEVLSAGEARGLVDLSLGVTF
jgi:hypothetical protein